jgi:hypothetical protein
MKYLFLIVAGLLLFGAHVVAQVATPDPNFHIYLCFGQSNMEGNAKILDQDRLGVSPRFKVMTVSADDYSHLGRSTGQWYTAVPPLCRWDTGLTPADYFGRTLTDSLPDSVQVGVIVIAMGGSGIDAFDKDNYAQYYQNADAWQKSLMNIYGGKPYSKMVSLAKVAKRKGVIKGILMHQGESNNMQQDWPLKVRKIYSNLLTDLKLGADSVPLLIGEMLQQNQGGICWGMNSIIATMPNYVANAHVISSANCTGNGTDGFHFSTEGARELGKRYGLQMLSLLKTYTTVEGQTVDRLVIKDSAVTMLKGSMKKVPLTAVYADGHSQDICMKATYEISNPDAVRITDGIMEAVNEGDATITARYKGALGEEKQVEFSVKSTSFPLTKGLFNPSIFEKGSFYETSKTLYTGKYGFGGWVYTNGIDLSGYKYLVFKLSSIAYCGASLRLFDENSYWSGAAQYDFKSNKQVVVPLESMVKSGTTTKVDPSHLYIIGLWSDGSSEIKINEVYVTNNDDYTKMTGIEEVQDKVLDENEPVDVYSVMGIKIRSHVLRKEATLNLPEGMYLVGNQKILISKGN